MSWQDELDHVCRSWHGTPYMPGACMRGRGADCRYFVMGVLDELCGVTAPLPPRLAPDTSIHSRLKAIQSVRQIVSRYPCSVLRTGDVEPGDVVLCRDIAAQTALSTPAHVIILGKNPFEAWHATRATGVARTGFGAFSSWIIRIYRVHNKHTWRRRR